MFAVQQFEEGCLAPAVAADQPELPVRTQWQGNVVEYRWSAVVGESEVGNIE